MKTADDTTEGLRNAGLAVIALGVVVAGLVLGRAFLVPLAIAILLWNLLEAMIEGFASVAIGPYKLPRSLATILGITAVVLGFYLVSSILLGQADAIGAAWPRYIARFESIVSDLTQWLGAEWAAKIREAVAAIDLTGRIPRVIASTQSIIVNFLLVVAYIGFLFVERSHLGAKVAAMFPDTRRARETSLLFATISESVRRYIWI
jgi:AI-2 transport protein TqsA